jgi:hypothetical protein
VLVDKILEQPLKCSYCLNADQDSCVKPLSILLGLLGPCGLRGYNKQYEDLVSSVYFMITGITRMVELRWTIPEIYTMASIVDRNSMGDFERHFKVC